MLTEKVYLENEKWLPSPEQLKHKILIKHKVPKKEATEEFVDGGDTSGEKVSNVKSVTTISMHMKYSFFSEFSL